MVDTYDYTRDGDGSIQSEFFRKSVLIKTIAKVEDIIASNTTLTANGVIAATDVIQLVDVPYGFIFLHSVIRTITPEGAALTADIGRGGSNEMYSNFSLNLAADSITEMLYNVSWGAAADPYGYAFEAADTIDMTFDHETDAGEWYLYMLGYFLD